MRYQLEFIMHQYWPLSIFIPKLPHWTDILTLIAIILFSITLIHAINHQASITRLTIIIGLLVIATNLLQGYQAGFILPISGQNQLDHAYYQDARLIHQLPNFIRNYVTIQPTLGYHARVHPPLPIIAHFLINQVSIHPLLHTAVFFLGSLGLIPLYYHAAKKITSSLPTATLVATIGGLLPAFQIYALASLDALIATVFFAAILSYWHQSQSWKTLLLTFIASQLTFGFVWLLPIFYVISIATTKQPLKTWLTFITKLVGCLVGLFLLTRYNYFDSFKVAASFEGSHHFFQSVSTFVSYLVTRLQNLLEPAVFLGPLMLILIYQSLTPIFSSFSKIIKHLLTATPLTLPKHQLPSLIALASLASFIGFILTGAYYTGETARAAFYLIPPLIVSLTPRLAHHPLTHFERHLLLGGLIATNHADATIRVFPMVKLKRLCIGIIVAILFHLGLNQAIQLLILKPLLTHPINSRHQESTFLSTSLSLTKATLNFPPPTISSFPQTRLIILPLPAHIKIHPLLNPPKLAAPPN
jgi:hypothetical protein